MIYFIKKFNVDILNFNIKKYFMPEGDSILSNFIRNLIGKSDPKENELTVGHLEKAVIKAVWMKKQLIAKDKSSLDYS